MTLMILNSNLQVQIKVSDQEKADKLAIDQFREYLRIPTVHPNVDYCKCIDFLKGLAEDLQLPYEIHRFFPNKPILVITWLGSDSSLPSILLNSHMDVVPVFREYWGYDPFGAEMDEDGNIFGRGAQDDKCLGITYLAAIRKLKQSNFIPKRTFHVTFVPDEEIGGVEGMRRFVDSEEFEALNVGFALDEGSACARDDFLIFYSEKTLCQMRFCCRGISTNGSTYRENTSGERLRFILNALYDFRDDEIDRLITNPHLTTGDIISINVTHIEGGAHTNVIPPEFNLIVDCRLPPDVDIASFEELIEFWCTQAGEDIIVEFLLKEEHIPATNLDETNVYWTAFEAALRNLNISIKPHIMEGCTDARYLRATNIPCIGFSPINNTPMRAHSNDEFLNSKVFLQGISIYCEILKAVGNVDELAESVESSSS